MESENVVNGVNTIYTEFPPSFPRFKFHNCCFFTQNSKVRWALYPKIKTHPFSHPIANYFQRDFLSNKAREIKMCQEMLSKLLFFFMDFC